MKKVGVIGIGNPLRRDDGIGIVLVQKLREQKKTLPKYLEFIDGGTGGMSLLHSIVGFETVLCIDAVQLHAPPGSSRVFTIDDIKKNKDIFETAPHEINLVQVIELAKQMGELPKKLRIFGVQPKDMSYSEGLSKELTQKIDTLLFELKKEIISIHTSTR
jgi:hydrogenase maturation protease